MSLGRCTSRLEAVVLPTLARSCSKIGSARCKSLKSLRPAMLPIPDILFSRALGYISSNYHDLTAINRGFHASSYPARYYFVPSLNINWTTFAANSFSHTENVGGTAGPHVMVHQRYKQISLRSIVVFQGQAVVYLHRTSVACHAPLWCLCSPAEPPYKTALCCYVGWFFKDGVSSPRTFL